MRASLHTILFFTALCSQAQVELNRPIEFTSPTPGERQLSGLANPAEESNLASLGSVVSGFVHWCQITRNVDTLEIAPQFPMTSRANGQLLRFIMDSDSQGDTWIAVNGFPTSQLLDGDGNRINIATIRENELVQMQWQDSVYYLMTPPSSSCPSGYIQVSDALCIQASDNSSVDWFEANERCDESGARLCTWAEYVHACLNHGSQMTGLFNNWEWMDDTSDHTHTADQVGRFTCHSNRSRGATHQDFANFRCCYLLR